MSVPMGLRSAKAYEKHENWVAPTSRRLLSRCRRPFADEIQRGAYVPTLFVGTYAPLRNGGRRHAKKRHVCVTRVFHGLSRAEGPWGQTSEGEVFASRPLPFILSGLCQRPTKIAEHQMQWQEESFAGAVCGSVKTTYVLSFRALCVGLTRIIHEFLRTAREKRV